MPRKWKNRAPKPVKAKAIAPKSMIWSVSGLLNLKAAETTPEGKPKLRQFEMLAYTGCEMRLSGWGPPVVIDLDGLQTVDKLPILKNHDVEQIVGHTLKIKVDAAGIHAEGVISGVGAAAQEVLGTASNDFPWQASVGAEALVHEFVEPGAKVEVNGREFTGPLEISRQTKVGEISFVPRGADDQTSATVAASAAKKKRIRAMTFSDYVKDCGFDMDDLDDKQTASMRKCWKAEYPDSDDDKDADAAADDADSGDDDDKDADAAADDADSGDSPSDKDTKKKAGKKLNIRAQVKAGLSDGLKLGREQAAAEVLRCAEIAKRVRKHGVSEIKIDGKSVNLEAHAIVNGWDADRVELHALRNARPDGIVAGGLAYSTSAPDMNSAVLECAILQAGRHTADIMNLEVYDKLGARLGREIVNDIKARYSDKVQQAAHTHFKGRIGLQEALITAAIATSGKRMPHSIRDDDDIQTVLRANSWMNIRADGGSTMSIANVLSNVLNKFILAGYVFTEQTWREICSITPVKDFKPTKKINVFGDFVYKKLNADGQIINAAMSDEAFANQIDTFARKLNIGRQTIISDDLGALTQVPMLHGIGAMDSLNILFWTVWLNVMGLGPDGAAFWAARNVAANTLGGGALQANFISGGTSALSSAALQLARQTYAKQVKPNGQPLGVDLDRVLVPPELQQVMEELLSPKAEGLVYGGASAAKQPNINIFRGVYKPLMSRYISNTTFTGNSAVQWWALANPNVIPGIDVAFLNGQEMPTVRTLQPANDTLGIEVQGFWDYGVAPQNTRCGVKSQGS